MSQQTISAFAMANGHDRRTIQRRLQAHGIAPVATLGKSRFFRIADMEKVMLNEEDPHGLLAMDRDCRMLINAHAYLSQFLPACMEAALKPMKLSRSKVEIATVRLWAGLTQNVVNGLPAKDAQGTIPIIHTPCIQDIAEKHGLDLSNLKPLFT